MSLNTMHSVRHLFFLLLILVNLASCDSQRVAPSQPATPVDPVQQALADARALRSPQAEAALLDAVMLLIERQQYEEATHWLNTLPIPQLPANLRVRAIDASVQLALQRNDTEFALSVLTTDRLGLLSAQNSMSMADSNRFSMLRAQTYEQAGNYFLAAQERIFLSPLLSEGLYHANHESIWHNLTALPVSLLNELRSTAALPEARGWLELAWLYKVYQDNLDKQITEIQAWRKQFPHHAANLRLPQSLATLIELVDNRPQQIAVLLPQSGRFQSAGQAIVQGFMAAHFAATTGQPGTRKPLQLRFYDTAPLHTFPDVLQQALSEGAELIIGPLQKEHVTHLFESATDLPIPVLALNYYDSSSGALSPDTEGMAATDAGDTVITPPASTPSSAGFPSLPLSDAPAGIKTATEPPRTRSLFQFGLSAEQEAAQLAERAFRYEFHRAAIFFPSNPWGERVQQAFNERWSELGGQTLIASSYAGQADFGKAIQQLLLMQESELRMAELRYLIGPNFEHEPRRRHDIDFVVLIANPAQARQIKPLFNFHYAADLPVLATSHIFSGEPNPGLDRDLNRIEFCDIPWFFGEQSDAKQHLEAAWPQSDPRFSRLNALGVDAYRLISRLQLLVAVPGSIFYGATGALALDEQHQIQRQLGWYRMNQGRPVEAPELAMRTMDADEEMDADDDATNVPETTRGADPAAAPWPASGRPGLSPP